MQCDFIARKKFECQYMQSIQIFHEVIPFFKQSLRPSMMTLSSDHQNINQFMSNDEITKHPNNNDFKELAAYLFDLLIQYFYGLLWNIDVYSFLESLQ